MPTLKNIVINYPTKTVNMLQIKGKKEKRMPECKA